MWINEIYQKNPFSFFYIKFEFDFSDLFLIFGGIWLTTLVYLNPSLPYIILQLLLFFNNKKEWNSI